MKAILRTEYGTADVLQLKELPKPTPKDNEILIKVYATSVNFGDLMARNFKTVSRRRFNMPFMLWPLAKISFGIRKPNITILGNELAGEIEAVGKNVKSFKKGDQVFGYPSQSFGGYAEYLCVPEDGCLAIKPATTTYEQAARRHRIDR